MYIQVMEDHEHPELEWDPLDITKLWPEDQCPLRHVGHIVLNRITADFHNEVEQVAFGTGVIVDGIDFLRGQAAAGPHLSPTRTRSVTGSGRTTCSCRSTRRAARSRPTSAAAR